MKLNVSGCKRNTKPKFTKNSSCITGGPDVVFDSSADKTMYENLNRTCIKDLNENVLHYVYLTLF